MISGINTIINLRSRPVFHAAPGALDPFVTINPVSEPSSPVLAWKCVDGTPMHAPEKMITPAISFC